MPARFLSLVIGLVALLAIAGGADDWPQWRGARWDGNSNEKGLPTQWSPDQNVLWRLVLPGPAGASPVVVGDRIFVVSPDDQAILLMCVDLDGKELWRRQFGQGNRTVREDEGNAASPSPVADSKHVWALDTNGNLACYDHGGTLVWKKNLQDEYGRYDIQFGMTSTPILHQGRLYLQLIHGSMRDQETSRGLIVALNADDGREVWTHTRLTDGTAENKHSYASPTIYLDGDKSLLIVHGADYVTAHRLADGQEVWRCGGLNPKENYNPYLRFVASPTCAPGLVIAPSAKGGPVVAIRPENSGDLTDQPHAIAWRLEKGTPDVSSPIVVDGLVFLCGENGILSCVDAADGTMLYRERTENDRHRASPVAADGNVYLTSRRGVVTVVKASRDFEVVARNDLGESTSASPAIANGRIYIRTFDALYAIGK